MEPGGRLPARVFPLGLSEEDILATDLAGNLIENSRGHVIEICGLRRLPPQQEGKKQMLRTYPDDSDLARKKEALVIKKRLEKYGYIDCAQLTMANRSHVRPGITFGKFNISKPDIGILKQIPNILTFWKNYGLANDKGAKKAIYEGDRETKPDTSELPSPPQRVENAEPATAPIKEEKQCVIGLPVTFPMPLSGVEKLKWVTEFGFWRQSDPIESGWTARFRIFLAEPLTPEQNIQFMENAAEMIPWRDHQIPGQTRVQELLPDPQNAKRWWVQRTAYAQMTEKPDLSISSKNHNWRRTSPWLVVIYLFCGDRNWLLTTDVRGGILPKLFIESEAMVYHTNRYHSPQVGWNKRRLQEGWYEEAVHKCEAERRWAVQLIGRGQTLEGVRMPPVQPSGEGRNKITWTGV